MRSGFGQQDRRQNFERVCGKRSVATARREGNSFFTHDSIRTNQNYDTQLKNSGIASLTPSKTATPGS